MAGTPALIAVVDDDPYVCKALRRLLRSSGYAVETHASGMEFLRRVEDRHAPIQPARPRLAANRASASETRWAGVMDVTSLDP